MVFFNGPNQYHHHHHPVWKQNKRIKEKFAILCLYKMASKCYIIIIIIILFWNIVAQHFWTISIEYSEHSSSGYFQYKCIVLYWIFVVISPKAIVNFQHQNAWKNILSIKKMRWMENRLFRWYQTELLYL